MKKIAFSGVLLVLVCGLAGCKSKHEAAVDDANALMTELCDIIEGVTDDASAQAAIPKIESVGTRLKELGERARTLGTPPKEEQEKLQKRYQEKWEQTGKRLKALEPKLKTHPVLAPATMRAMFSFVGVPAGLEGKLPGGGPFPPNNLGR